MGRSDKKETKTYGVLRGENMNVSHLRQVMAIDKIVYGAIDEGFVGTLENMILRFERNRKSFVCITDTDKHTGLSTIVGYINFFPVCDKLFDQIVGPVKLPELSDEINAGFDPESYFEPVGAQKDGDNGISYDRDAIISHYCSIQGKTDGKTPDFSEVLDFYNTCRDDDISPEEINPVYYPDRSKNNIFIISVAIHPDHRSKNASTQLTDAFIDYLNDLDGDEECGIPATPVNSISAVCISPSGEKFLRGLNFYCHREIKANSFKLTGNPFDTSVESEYINGFDAIGESGNETIKRYDEESGSDVDTDYHERIYLCWGYYLDCLKESRIYHKTHKDDIYLFVPLAENTENNKIDKLLKDFDRSNSNLSLQEKKEKFYYNGIIPGSDEDETGKKKTQKLLENLNYFMDYEYSGFIKKDLERIYLGECLFRHMTDRYIEDDAQREGKTAIGETVGEEKADLLLLAYRSAHMYVLVIYLADCKYSSSMAGDQLSKMKLEKRSFVDEFGFYHYISITEDLKNKYDLVVCGRGKAFYCMNKKPSNGGQYEIDEDESTDSGIKKKNYKDQELMNILTGETYFSVHQDFYIKKYDKLREQLTTNLAIYDYYEAYMSPVSLVMILDTFDRGDQKIEDAATYVFIVELVLLQNTSLTKLSRKVGVALEHEGDVPNEYISDIYKEYGRTLKLWDTGNFKYYGTQMEAEQIRKAFENDELKEKYEKEQEYLENIVEVNSAKNEKRTNWILGVLGAILAIFQVRDYLFEKISAFYIKLGELTGHPESIGTINASGELENVSETLLSNFFDVAVWGGLILFALALFINERRKKFEQERNLHTRKDDE